MKLDKSFEIIGCTAEIFLNLFDAAGQIGQNRAVGD